MAKQNNLPKLQPGDLVAGRFRIVEVIGSGGFSVVYRAHQEEMNRFIALKVLKPQASNDAKIVERFRREALYASHLSHPNTITLYDYGHTDDLCYIAMEYLVGMDLSAVVQKHIPMDLKRIWKVIVQSCRSLAEAHRLGLVHRDLKPENIFLEQREEGEFVKVLDFGVSKAISSFGDAGPSTLAPLTQEGTVFGTPLYMAPEQAMAESITPAVDVYALGHMMFEMVTGYAAYDGATNAMDVMLKQINDPPLALPEPWNDTPFNQLITLCTQKDPTHRVPNATQLLDHLMSDQFEPWVDPEEKPARTLTMPRVAAINTNTANENFADLESVYRWELSALDEVLREVVTLRETRVVLIRGMPGTGRSNLLRGFISKHVTNPDFRILHRGFEPTEANPGIEHELSALTGDPIQGTGIEEVKRILRGIYGDHEDFVQTADELGTDSQPLDTLTSIRDSLFGRIGGPFREAAEQTPVIWALENLERLDTLTLAFIDRFFRDLQAHPSPVLIVVTVYPEDLKRRPGVVRYTHALMQTEKPFGHHLVLIPPGETKVDENAATIPDDAPPDGSYVGLPNVSEEAPVTIRMSKEELAAVFPDDHTDQYEAENPEDAFDRVLGYLAQLGDEIPVELWKLVYARIMDISLVRVVDTVIQQADKFGIIIHADDYLRFAKPGFAEMLRDSFDELPNAEENHRELAKLLEEFYVTPSHEDITLIAKHWRLGSRPATAVDRLVTAGDAAFQSLDLDAAREYFLQVQKIFDASPDIELRHRDDGLNQSQIWLRLGEVHGALGEYGASEDALQRAISLADANDRAVHGRSNKLLGDLAASQERYDDALRLYELARECFRQNGQANPFVNITSEMGQAALLQGRAGLAEELCRQALEMASKLQDKALVGRVHRHLGQVLCRRGRFIEAEEYLEKSRELFEALRRDQQVVECLDELGYAALAEGQYGKAREHFMRAITLSISAHVRPYNSRVGLARALMANENFDQAEGNLREALAWASTQRDLTKMAELHVHLSDLAFAKQQWEPARQELERVIEIAESIGQFRYVITALVRLAYVAYHAGEGDRAYEYLGEALQNARHIGDPDFEFQIRAHLIYLQLLQHGFRAKGDTFSSLLQASTDAELSRTSVLCYLFKADCEIARGHYTDARDLLRFAKIAAAQIGDYTLFIPIARRHNIVQKELGLEIEPGLSDGYAIGSLVPPEVGPRRFNTPPEASK